MLISVLFCLLLEFLSELWPCARGFNLEPRLPIMKRGEKDSYFGYSVAQHLSLDSSGDVKNRWLLVGAPRGQNLQPGTNHSGAVYKCPLTTYSNDCEQILTDGKRDPITGEYEDTITQENMHQPDYRTEIKDGQWLGVNVRSQGPGKQVLVCAHRYINKGPDFHWGQGLCYTLGQDLEWHDKWEPCKGRPTKRAHEQWGVCQAGTSALLMDDETALIGSPGAYTWRGTLFALNVSTDYLTRDKTVYYAPVLDGESPVGKYSYLGFSVTSGRFLGDHVSYVAGAPRSEGVGEVYFFRKVTKSAPLKSILELELTLRGEVFASSYGYEITSADLNGDSLPDLIVGAPFYYARNKGGAVYVYMNSKEGWMENSEFIRVEGKPESRFGFALANLGDLNNDGYEDLAVGAPYEDDGCVYIYLGSKSGFQTKPMQVLRSEQLPWPHPKTFGYSLSGKTDVDGNGYPDLLVGAYGEDKVYLILSRPVLEITTRFDPIDNMSNIDPSGRGCIKDALSPNVCFSFKTCFKMQTPERDIKIAYRIEAETFAGKKFSRVRFVDGLPERSNVVARDMWLVDTDAKEYHCFDETVYLKEGVQDIQSPIDFKLTYRLIQDEPPVHYEGGKLPDLRRYPILNQQEAIKIFQAQFHKDCGDNDVCESELYVESSLNLLTGPDGYWTLNLGEQEEIVLNISIKNFGEAAYSAGLYVHHPPSVTFTGRSKETETGQFDCTQMNSTLVMCHLGNPFKHGEGEVRLRFNPKGLEDNIGQIEFKVYTNTTSEDVRKQEAVRLQAQVVKRAELTLTSRSRPDDVFFGGEVVGDSALKYIDDIGTEVFHVYDVLNHGPWRVNRLVVEVDWPYEIETDDASGKRVLYLTEVPYIIGGGKCEVEAGQVNYLGLPTRPESQAASYVRAPGHVGDTVYSAGVFGSSGGSVEAQAVTSRTKDKKEKKKTTNYKKTFVSKKTWSAGDGDYVTERTESYSEGSHTFDQEEWDPITSRARGGLKYSGGMQGEADHVGEGIREGNTFRKSHVSFESRSKSGANDSGLTWTETKTVDYAGGDSGDDRLSSRTNGGQFEHLPAQHTRVGDRGGEQRRQHSSSSYSSSSGDNDDEENSKLYTTSDPSGRRGGSNRYRGRNWDWDSDNQEWERMKTSWKDSQAEWEVIRKDWENNKDWSTVTETSNVLEERIGDLETSRREGDLSRVSSSGGKDDEWSRGGSWGRVTSGGRDGGRKVHHQQRVTVDHSGAQERGSGRGPTGRLGQVVHSSGFSRQEYEQGGDDGTSQERGRGSSHMRRQRIKDDGHYEDQDHGQLVDRELEEGDVTGDRHYVTRPRLETGRRRYDDRTEQRRDWETGRQEESTGAARGTGAQQSRFTELSREVPFDVVERKRGSGSRRNWTHKFTSVSRDSTHLSEGQEEGSELQSSRLKDLEVGPGQGGGLRLEGSDEDAEGSQAFVVQHKVTMHQFEDSEKNHQRRSRQKRRVEQVIQPEVVKDGEGRKMKKVVLTCGQNARCERFRCVVRNLLPNQSATIRIPARLRNSTFVEDYSAIDQIHIASRGSVRVLDTFFQQYDLEDDHAEAVTIAKPDRVFSRTEGRTVPIWIIIVSVMAGVLLLVIISLILWRLGFFKRKRPTVNANGDAEHEKLNGK